MQWDPKAGSLHPCAGVQRTKDLGMGEPVEEAGRLKAGPVGIPDGAERNTEGRPEMGTGRPTPVPVGIQSPTGRKTCGKGGLTGARKPGTSEPNHRRAERHNFRKGASSESHLSPIFSGAGPGGNWAIQCDKIPLVPYGCQGKCCPIFPGAGPGGNCATQCQLFPLVPYGGQGKCLSLIHISEPTRPY